MRNGPGCSQTVPTRDTPARAPVDQVAVVRAAQCLLVHVRADDDADDQAVVAEAVDIQTMPHVPPAHHTSTLNKGGFRIPCQYSFFW